MNTKDEALRLALEALEYIRNCETDVSSQTKYGQAEEVIKQALEQPEPAPVAHTLSCVCGAVWDIKTDGSEEMVHTPDPSPPKREWQGLTDEEMHECWDSPLTPLGMKHARMIEAKLKEKNT